MTSPDRVTAAGLRTECRGSGHGWGVVAAEGRPLTAKGCPLDRAALLLPDAVRPTRETRASRRRYYT